MTRPPTGMRTLSLCTGYGGLELGLRAAGIPTDLVAVADPDPAAAKVLTHHYPDIPNLRDITTVTKQAWTDLGPIDIVCAGYPCQGFSHAGKRKGIEDERFIWPAVADAIRVLRPRRVLLENVAGHRSLGFGRVLGDLAAVRYVGSWVSVRASDVGAAHQRERVFIYAEPTDIAGVGHRDAWPPRIGGSSGALMPTPTAVDGMRATVHYPHHPTTLPDAVAQLLPTPRTSDTNGAGLHGSGGVDLRTAVALLPTPNTGLTPNGHGRRGGKIGNGRQSGADLDAIARAGDPELWGQYAPAIARWETVLGRPAPEPTEPGRNGKPRLAPRFSEWLMGLPDGWVCDVPSLTRNDMLRLLGNGVVPQQAAYAVGSLHNIA